MQEQEEVPVKRFARKNITQVTCYVTAGNSSMCLFVSIQPQNEPTSGKSLIRDFYIKFVFREIWSELRKTGIKQKHLNSSLTVHQDLCLSVLHNTCLNLR